VKLRLRSVALVAGSTALLAATGIALAQNSQASTPTAKPPKAPANLMGVAPYIYGGGIDLGKTMSQTGVKWFTVAFVLNKGNCTPVWDGESGLGGLRADQIKQIRAAGGDAVPSFGGWSGNKLGEHCSNAGALAKAYQKVIDQFGFKGIDIDIENTEVGNATVRQRVIDALKIVKQKNPGIKEFITVGTGVNGPDGANADMIKKGAKAGVEIDGWTIMPFDYGTNPGDMGKTSIKAAEGLRKQLESAYGYSADQAYRHSGISSMNGKDDDGHVINQGDFQEMLKFAQDHHIARFTFWTVNRDNSCSGGSSDTCSGIPQKPLEFSKIIGKYQG
jgi:chitinase